MKKLNNVFAAAKNVEFTGSVFVKEVGRELPCYTLTEPTVEEWNAIAKRINTESFILKFGRQPKDYDEVLQWVNSLVTEAEEKAMQAGTYMTL